MVINLSIFQKANRAGVFLVRIQNAGGDIEGKLEKEKGTAVPPMSHLANVVNSELLRWIRV